MLDWMSYSSMDIPVLKRLNKEKVADYSLRVEYKEKERKGHWDVGIYLEDQEGRRSATACVQGLYSVGRVDAGATGHFFQTELKSQIEFIDETNNRCTTVILIYSPLAECLYKSIGHVIRPGGQLFISYVNEKSFSEHCEKPFRLGIPPIATTLGKLVALSGCIKVWSHYGAEGRGRIEGEKPATTQGKLKSTREMLGVLNEYLASQPRSVSEKSLEAICRDNARKLIMHFARRGKWDPWDLTYQSGPRDVQTCTNYRGCLREDRSAVGTKA